MDELLQQAAEAMNAPASMVERSARARAQSEGVSVEDVLRAWAGGGEIVASGGGGDAPAAESTASEPAPEAAAEAEPEEPKGPEVEVVGDADVPADDELEAAEPAEEDEVVDDEELVVAGGVPNWLVAVFIIVPVFAITYALFLPNGPNCGDAGRLAVDPITGEAVGCDGSAYGEGTIDFFAIGEETYASCAACHGANGGGNANFPGFTGGAILATFPTGQCESHVEWVRIGTADWPDPTYGATETPVGSSGALMPGFGNSLTETELRAVVLYERVAFGNADLDAAIEDCGLGAEGETAALGE
ncbi:MAG: c-type cytochrome [Acidimicrobiia bacterium]|nr:c-type cytochrome [Acidimicrobiia bacterium]